MLKLSGIEIDPHSLSMHSGCLVSRSLRMPVSQQIGQFFPWLVLPFFSQKCAGEGDMKWPAPVDEGRVDVVV